MGIGADHDVGTGLHELLRQRPLLGVRAGLRLGAPVDVDDHCVGTAAHLLDLADQLGRVDGGGDAALAIAVAVQVETRLSAMTWVAAMIGDALPVDGDPVGGEGLCRVAADPDDRVAGLRGDGQVL